MARLFLLHYSPWSEKARWALDHHRVAYQRVDHVPMLGEPRLRLAAGRLRGRVSVPLFVDGDLVLGDSLDIARHAERVGTGDPLFSAGKERAIERWNTLSNDLAGAARGRVIAGTIADRDAQRAALPRGLPSFLAPMAATGASFLARKYAARDEGASAVARMRALLDEVRAALGGRRYVFDSLSYADIAVAAAMQAVSPVADRHLPLAAATRRVWKDETLARDFSDLVQWRDDLYDRHRR